MTATAPNPLSTRSAIAAHLAVSAVALDVDHTLIGEKHRVGGVECTVVVVGHVQRQRDALPVY